MGKKKSLEERLSELEKRQTALEQQSKSGLVSATLVPENRQSVSYEEWPTSKMAEEFNCLLQKYRESPFRIRL